jgi:hypothetical protein
METCIHALKMEKDFFWKWRKFLTSLIGSDMDCFYFPIWSNSPSQVTIFSCSPFSLECIPLHFPYKPTTLFPLITSTWEWTQVSLKQWKLLPIIQVLWPKVSTHYRKSSTTIQTEVVHSFSQPCQANSRFVPWNRPITIVFLYFKICYKQSTFHIIQH